MKICCLGTELFHAEGRTEKHDTLIVPFLSYAEAPNYLPLPGIEHLILQNIASLLY
jgi:hypothetical protein